MKGERVTITTTDGGTTALVVRRSGGYLHTDERDRDFLVVTERNGSQRTVDGARGEVLRKVKVRIEALRSVVYDTVADSAEDAAVAKAAGKRKAAAS